MDQDHDDQEVGAPEMNAADQPTEVHAVLDELHARVSRGWIPGRVGDVVEREQHAGQELEDDQDEDHPAEAVVEGVGEVRDTLVESFVDGFGERVALVEPVDNRHLDVARVWDCHLKAEHYALNLDVARVDTLLPG